MNDFFWLGVATGLPWASKPFFSAVSCDEPGTGEPSGMVSCALGAAVTAGPGGNSSGPARPQADKPSAAAPSASTTAIFDRPAAKTRIPKA